MISNILIINIFHTWIITFLNKKEKKKPNKAILTEQKKYANKIIAVN